MLNILVPLSTKSDDCLPSSPHLFTNHTIIHNFPVPPFSLAFQREHYLILIHWPAYQSNLELVYSFLTIYYQLTIYIFKTNQDDLDIVLFIR